MSIKIRSLLSFLCLQLLICLYKYKSYKISNSLIRSNHYRSTLFATNNKDTESWPGTRPPIVNMEILEQSMDATWGRGKYRTEVWEDDVNPTNDWWLAYTPSEEEIEAAGKGYNFKDAAAWFKAKGIDYESAKLETEKLTAARFEKYLMQKEELDRTFTMEEFKEFQDKFFEMQRQAFKVSFRIADNKLQEKKGQPSLDVEDTGIQWRNDPI